MRALCIRLVLVLMAKPILSNDTPFFRDNSATAGDVFEKESKDFHTAMRKLRLNELQLLKDHNSYKAVKKPDHIYERLELTQVIELDLILESREWLVGHSPFGHTEGKLEDYLKSIRQWHDHHPHHDPIWINCDLKNVWMGIRESADFDKTILTYFNETVLFRPKDLKGDHDNIRDAAASEHGWPEQKELQGRVIIVITGGFYGLFNVSQKNYLWNRVILNHYEAVAFVAPVASDNEMYKKMLTLVLSALQKSLPGEAAMFFTFLYRRGDLQGIEGEAKHVVMYNVNWNARDEIDYHSMYERGILLWFWNVDKDELIMNEAIHTYNASVIGCKGIGLPDYTDEIGERGRFEIVPSVLLYQYDDGWKGNGDLIKLELGKYDNKGHSGSEGNPLNRHWSDKVRALKVPRGVSVDMAYDTSSKTGRNADLTVHGPKIINIFSENPSLAGRVLSIEVYRTNSRSDGLQVIFNEDDSNEERHVGTNGMEHNHGLLRGA